MRGLLIDLDGVMYTGREAIPGSAGFLAAAREHGMPFLLVTNDSTASPQHVADRLRGMHMPVEAREIVTSAQAAAGYVRAHTPGSATPRVRLIGEAGLRAAALEQGLVLVEDGARDVDWLIAGLDRAFDYEKLTLATRSIRAGARFLATNADALLPIEGGEVIPGAGSIIAAIRTASAVEPIVVGKPQPGLFEHGLRRLGDPPPAQVAMIGDRLDTDVVGARRAGLRTILTLSGVTHANDLVGLAASEHPEAVVPNLAAVATLLGWT